MSQADELMKGFQVGYQNAPFAQLGSAIKDTLGRLRQREDSASQMVMQGQIGQMFQDPMEARLRAATLEKTEGEAENLNFLNKRLRQMGGGDIPTGDISTGAMRMGSGTQRPGSQPAGGGLAAGAGGTQIPQGTTSVVPPTKYSREEGGAAGRMFGQTPESKVEQVLYTDDVKSERDSTRKFQDAKIEKMATKLGDAFRVLGALRNIESGFKYVDEHEGGTGPMSYLKGKVAANPFAPVSLQNKARGQQYANAQMEETKIASLPIMSGQARYVVQLAEALEKTIPRGHRGINVRQDLLAQTTRNMLTLVFAIENGYTTAENLRAVGIDPERDNPLSEDGISTKAKMFLSGIQLSPEQEQIIDEATRYVINAPVAKLSDHYRDGQSGGEEVVPGYSSDEWEVIR